MPDLSAPPPPDQGAVSESASPDGESRRTADQLVELVRRYLPDWNSVGDPRFAGEEIDYKRRAAEKTAELLAEDELRQLAAREQFGEILDRLKKVARATNLLYLGTPSSGDLAVLHTDDMEPRSFTEAVLDLLYGDGESPGRLERFSTYLDERSLPNKWTFPTYLLFFRFPETEMFVKPRATRWLLDLARAEIDLGSRPTADAYREILALVHHLLTELEPFGARDLIDVQSVLFVAYQVSRDMKQLRPSDAKRREMERLFEDFVRQYLDTEEGREHMASYPRARQEARRSFDAIRAAREADEDVTDRVLLELLPHADNQGNRDQGAWIHIAPAITGDLKKWFEANGWRNPDDWDEVAAAVFHFVERVTAKPAELAEACREFDALPWSTGLQAGMLSPALNALQPDEFLLANSKPRLIINYLAGRKLSPKLVEYPEVNWTGKILIEHLADLLETGVAAGEGGYRIEDVFDTFTHWLVAIRHFPVSRHWKVAPGEGARYWDDWLEGGHMSIGWNDLGDLSRLSREEFEQKRDEMVEADEDMKPDRLEQVWKFAHEIREGDKIVANQGTGKVLGFGTVSGPYEFLSDEDDHGHRRPVDWDDTVPRQVSEGGWRRTLVSLEREKFEELVDTDPAIEQPQDHFTQETFDLLRDLEEEPTRDFYSARQDAFKGRLELPFQDLFSRVVEKLPDDILERMEAEKNVFSRIPKNDYGRGGAWPFYWGALYPEGGRRIEAAQLSLVIKKDRLEAGFYLGEYASGSRKRFLANLSRHRDALLQTLADTLSATYWLFGEDEARKGSNGPSWQEWLQSPETTGLDVSRHFPRETVLRLSQDELAREIAHIFEKLFPLVLLAVSDDPLSEIRHYRGLTDHPVKTADFPLPEMANALHLDLQEVERWVRAVERKRQVIFYGPPGTGKTYAAEHLADHLVGGGTGFKELIQFHPSYAYEDFMQGIRPEPHPEGGLSYPIRPGRFLNFCQRARRCDGTCVLILDEVNRANLSRVFGELMYLLENRGKQISLAAGGERFSIPKNVRIIGTMNTADRSIALVDHALRRRFAFLRLGPDYEVLRRFHEKSDFDPESLVELLTEVNQAIDDPHYELGITFFLLPDLEGQLADIWSLEIVPYLEEYFADRTDQVERFRWPNVQARLLP